MFRYPRAHIDALAEQLLAAGEINLFGFLNTGAKHPKGQIVRDGHERDYGRDRKYV